MPDKSVARTCPQCGAPNAPGHKFCHACGFSLDIGSPQGTPGGDYKLVAINPDGSEGTILQLAGTTTVGRTTGGVFSADMYLSPQHASFTPMGDHVVVTDEHSLNGVYRRLPADQRYPAGTQPAVPHRPRAHSFRAAQSACTG